MNYLSVALLITVVGLFANAVNAQERGPAPQNQSAGLITQPASVRPVRIRYRETSASYSSDQLNSIAGSIQVKPSKKSDDSPIKIPDSISNVLVPPAPASTSVDPIDFFKVPAPDNGVKVRLDGGQR